MIFFFNGTQKKQTLFTDNFPLKCKSRTEYLYILSFWSMIVKVPHSFSLYGNWTGWQILQHFSFHASHSYKMKHDVSFFNELFLPRVDEPRQYSKQVHLAILLTVWLYLLQQKLRWLCIGSVYLQAWLTSAHNGIFNACNWPIRQIPHECVSIRTRLLNFWNSH